MPRSQPDVLIKRLDPGVPLPAYAHPGDAGADLSAAEDVELGDEKVLIKRGDGVICLLGAGNRDPARYEDPEKLDITRQNVRPLSFGGGIHHCLGAQLARLEGEIVFRALAGGLPNLRLEDIDNPQWRPTLTLRRLASLPARW